MVDIVDTPSTFVPVVRPETTDIVLGGNETNFPGRQLKSLAQRDKYLFDQIAAGLGTGDAVAQNSFNQFKAAGIAALAQGRLGLVSGDPIAGASNGTVLHYTPFNGNLVSLYNTSLARWESYPFSERSVSLAGLLANTNYDIFIFDNTGTLTLQAIAWTSATIRASAISRQNGIWVKTSDGRRYLGTIRTTATAGQCSDDASRRFVFNANNATPRFCVVGTSGSWTYSLAVFRASNNNTTTGQARIEVVTGLDQQIITVTAISLVSSGSPISGAGLNSTTVSFLPFGAGGTIGTSANPGFGSLTTGSGVLPIGANYIQSLEQSNGGVSTVFGTIDLRAFLYA